MAQEKQLCSICGEEALLLHSIHEGMGTDRNPDGTPYKAAWYCQRHMGETLIKELKEMSSEKRVSEDSKVL